MTRKEYRWEAVAQEMVDKAGVDRQVLTQKLVAAAGAEFTTSTSTGSCA